MTQLPKSPLPAASSQTSPWAVVSLFAPYLRIAHQLPGRIRLKVDTAALKVPALRGLGTAGLKQALAAVRGVQDFSFNLLAQSCTVHYDNTVIADCAWSDLLAGKATPEAQSLIDILDTAYQEFDRAQL